MSQVILEVLHKSEWLPEVLGGWWVSGVESQDSNLTSLWGPCSGGNQWERVWALDSGRHVFKSQLCPLQAVCPCPRCEMSLSSLFLLCKLGFITLPLKSLWRFREYLMPCEPSTKIRCSHRRGRCWRSRPGLRATGICPQSAARGTHRRVTKTDFTESGTWGEPTGSLEHLSQHLSRDRTLSFSPVAMDQNIWPDSFGVSLRILRMWHQKPQNCFYDSSVSWNPPSLSSSADECHWAQRVLLFLCRRSLASYYRDTLNSSKSNSRLPFFLFSPSGSTPFITLKCQSIFRDRCYILAFYNITRPRRDTVSLRKWTPYPVSEGLKPFKETEEAVNPDHILILSSLSCPLSIPAE